MGQKMKLFRKVVHQSTACLLAFLVINLPVWALNASDATVTAGNANKSQVGNTVAVDLVTSRAVLDWTQMNATSAETLNFTGASGFAVLNRVNSLVSFNGTLNGNGGRVYIVSPNGVNIGPDANITAAGFIASGLNISNPNFMAGNDQFVPFAPKQIGTITHEGRINAHDVALLGSNVLNKGTIVSDGGLVVLATGDQIILGTEGSNVMVTLDAVPVSGGTYNVMNDTTGRIENADGTIVLAAGDTFAQALSHSSAGSYKNNTYSVEQKGYMESRTAEFGAASQVAVRAGSTTTVADELNIGAGKVRLENTLASGGTLTMDADYGINALSDITSEEEMRIKAASVQVRGDVVSNDTLSIEADTLYSRGDILSEDDLLLMAETTLWGDSDQHIRSEMSSVKSTKAVAKITQGSLYISADQNVQLDGDVSADRGGVSVIAENGKIHTGDGTEALNIAIRGYSNDITESAGVELPSGEGKAAIVLLSHDTLKLGTKASLKAEGFYLSAENDPMFGVDDRPDMTWLQEDAEFIGGWERDEGIASDVAIYVGSKTGNVQVSTPQIETAQAGRSVWFDKEIEVISGPATVIFDAYDTVTMPAIETIMDSRGSEMGANNFRGFRLEVDSRITEWLYQAVNNGTLPYAYDPEAVAQMLEQDYVLRGAGLNNPSITDGRAWVLENPPALPAAPLADLVLPELKGCPVELDTAANELSINTDDLQILIGNAMATNPNLQPCEACQRLLIAADALRDRDGERMAAINRIFNTLAPIDAPFTPEISAAVSTALADLADRDPQYALAADYIESFVAYVAVINSGLKIPVGDPLMYTLNKYGQPLLNNSNKNIVSYLISRMETTAQPSSIAEAM
jgi:filamentous hemagglutinin family protein